MAHNHIRLMENFAGYGFNKSHSVAYALLLTRQPVESPISRGIHGGRAVCGHENTDKIVRLIEELREMKLVLKPLRLIPVITSSRLSMRTLFYSAWAQ